MLVSINIITINC